MATIRNTVPATVGGSLPRIDGPLKVSGAAMYTSDHHFPGMLYAVPVCSTIAKGRIASLDSSVAVEMPGIQAVYHQGNIGPLFRSAPASGLSAYLDERRPPLEDDVIRYYGQYVAVVIAQTFEQAVAAASAVKVVYTEEKPDARTHLDPDGKPSVDSSRGTPDEVFASASIKHDETYGTPVETHNPIELHASVAVWDGQSFTLYETSQGVVNHREVLAQMLGVPQENVRVISRFLGSGFGGKLFPWPHSALAAAASRNLNRPVKLVVSRQMMFQNVGHRPRTQQRVRLSATAEGRLTSLQHDYLNHTSILDDYKENCGEATTYLYGTPNLRVTSGLVRRNIGTPTSMRGPGAVPGLFATESAMDELAIKLKMDPVELRLLNEPEKDEGNDLPFSSRHLSECLTIGARKFGWSQRTPEVGSMKKDGLTLGWGMASCSWIAERVSTEATVDLRNDGTARVSCATQDIGTGTYTILAQIVSEKTGLPLDKIEVVLGDTALPPGPISGGSWATASVIPAVSQAAQNAMQVVLTAATKGKNSPFSGQETDALNFENGQVYLKEKGGETGVAFHDILKQSNINAASGSGKSEGTFGSTAPRKYSTHSFGAQFAEVTWQPEIARLRVNRVVTVIDAGRIMNSRPARNQIEGSVVMGVGMALFEKTTYDPRQGAPINSNLADYIVATHADSPEIDVTFLDYPDLVLNEFGARGIGEIGHAGIASAITSAVYHATGVRVRELPVHIEDLLAHT
ncbi:xanthine dehydrogenase family protein molybdopterin-binding subunit [Mesorhizobium escarrei]|uniref:Xanthine dehydrogenase, molybdenum binding subunit n=1 Tax=Mesorhizobium escarrei TaxID=666018 RepID=A0ABM9E951_9HYPH|nr:xanthine dehydrogenase family protein molybdopterin-binding subunit [Mesorhizobium escarrei]CAH2405667.1 Xanthine dehydrogenase, molybdenum binding subunit [Mesorhizobium escarrei]